MRSNLRKSLPRLSLFSTITRALRWTIVSIIVLTCLCFNSKSVLGQSQLPSLNYIPQSPTAAAYSRYGDIPVDLSTGVPKIDIPIYTLKSGDITIPISISYHASGIKVQDVASAVGLGWTLNSGGVITRTVLGRRDEENNPSSYGNAAQFEELLFDKMGETPENQGAFSWGLYFSDFRQVDFYADRYYFNLAGGESGVFRNIKSPTGASTIVTIPYSPLKIEFLPQSNIKITSGDGSSYYFKFIWHDLWSLSKITNSSHTDSVMFYSHTEDESTMTPANIALFGNEYIGTDGRTYTDRTKIQYCYPDGEYPGYQLGIDVFPSNSSNPSKAVIIDSIVSSNTRVIFNYLADRQDRYFEQLGYKARLEKIQIKNGSTSEIIKTLNFFHSYFGVPMGNSARLRLDSISSGVNNSERHSFKYNSEHLPVYPPFAFSEDFWGYYNGQSGSTTLPKYFLPNPLLGVDRFPNEGFTKACMLEEIKYPTGGRTEFQFELNTVGYDPYNFLASNKPGYAVGGLRVKKITTYSSDTSSPLVKSYQYTPRDGPFFSIGKHLFVHNQQTYNTFLPSYCDLNGAEYTNSMVCVSNPASKIVGSVGAAVSYPVVTEYYGDGNVNQGKTMYYYSVQDEDPNVVASEDQRFLHPFQFDRGNFVPTLLKKEIFKNVNGIYTKIQATKSMYSEFKSGSILTGLNLASNLDFSSTTGTADAAFSAYIQAPDPDAASGYLYTLIYSDTYAYPVRQLETERRDTIFSENGSIETVLNKEYNEYLQLSKETIITSNNEQHIKAIKYPVDFKLVEPYKTMVDSNIIAPVVEESTSKNSTFLELNRTNYDFWSGTSWITTPTPLIVPRTIETQMAGLSAEPRIRYHTYDMKGNVQSVSKENGPISSYIWCYKHSQPVIKADNMNDADLRLKCDQVLLSLGVTGGIAQIEQYFTSLGDMTTSTQKNSWKLFNERLRQNLSESIAINTYTYKPLVGITSMTDPRGQTTTYEYDSFQRLQSVKDHNGNILKNYEYHYKP